MLRFVLFLSLFLLGPALAAVPLRELGVPLLSNISPREYGAHGQNWALAQDPRGVLYVGNTDGVLEFDGQRWRLIHLPNHSVVRALAVDGEGRVYVGGQRDFGFLVADAEGALQFESLLSKVPESMRDFDDIHHIFVRRDGIYFASYSRLFRLRGDELHSWKNETPFHRAFTARDRLFIRQRGVGLLELVDDQLVLIAGGEQFAEQRVELVLPFGEAESVLIGTRDQGLFEADAHGVRPWKTEVDAFLRAQSLYGGLRLDDGRLLLFTMAQGLVVITPDGREQLRVNRSLGLGDDTIFAALVDREGGVWLGLDRGLARVDVATRLTRFDERSGLHGAPVALARFEGRLYVGTGQGLFALADDASRRFEPVVGVNGQILALEVIGDTLLIGNNDGSFGLRQGLVQQLQRGDTGTTMAFAASSAQPGRVFVGLWDGLSSIRRDGANWIDEGRMEGIHTDVSSIYEDDSGALWLGSYTSGVTRVRFTDLTKGRFEFDRHGLEQGLFETANLHVQELGGRLAVTGASGVYRFDASQQRFVLDPALGDMFRTQARGVIGRIAQDERGDLFLQTIDHHHGVKQPGLASPDAEGRYHFSGVPLLALRQSQVDHILSDGAVVWLASGDGLFRFEKEQQDTHGSPYAALIRGVSDPRSGAVLFAGSGSPTLPDLPFARNSLRFEFSAPRFGQAGLDFQVLLEGNDADWSMPSPEAAREYTNLLEGTYRLRVRAIDAAGVLSDEAVANFRVLAPWYRSIWAALGYALLLMTSGWLLVRWRLRQARQETQLLEQLVAARTAELKRTNEDLERARQSAEAREREAELQRRDAEQQRVRAEEANRAKSIFLANMSHELRTPLNGVLGFAQLMDRSPNLGGTDRQHLATIQRSGEHLLGLINDVLALSRIEAGALQVERAAFDLHGLLRGVMDLVQVRADSKDLSLVVQIESLPAVVLGDARKISQVLLNLLGNAVKFTERGTVSLRGSYEDGNLVFEIADTGPGIAHHEVAHLFEPFVQTATGRAAKEGTGLGLALSRDLARLMDGDITLRSEPSRGTSVRFYLPVTLASADSLALDPVPAGRVRALEPGQGSVRVLVVDDVADNRSLLAGLLESVGFDVRQASSGGEAVSIWRDWQPRLIWLDKRMPGMDGPEVARLIRAEEARRRGRARVVIVALSASAMDSERADILDSGCDEFVPKPFRESVLFSTMQRLLGLRFVLDDVPQQRPVQSISEQRLLRQPKAWRKDLGAALAAGDLGRAHELVDGLEGDADLAIQLRTMLASYRLDELEALLGEDRQSD